MASETPGNLYKIDAMFKNVVKNTKRFNKGFLTYELKRVANGKQFYGYRNGHLLIEWSLLSDKYGYDLVVTTYKTEKEVI